MNIISRIKSEREGYPLEKGDALQILGLRLRRNEGVWILCALVSLCTSLIASPDCMLTHSRLGHIDTSWFYDCGRWLMSGYTPYVDFADSKGPLLWLWYGIGYLIDSDGWWGTWLLYVIYYMVIYRYVWKIARVMMGGDMAATMVTVMMPMAYYAFQHLESRAEDLAQLPLIYLLYLMTLGINGLKITSRQLFIAGSLLGVMLFVKWNFPAILLPGALIAAGFQAREDTKGKSIKRYLGAFGRNVGIGLAGCMVVICGVSVWMALAGSFTAMINEYFITTVHTFENITREQDTNILNVYISLIYSFKELYIYPIFTLIAGVYLYRGKGLWYIFTYIWGALIVLNVGSNYYHQIFNGYGIFMVISGVLLIRSVLRLRVWMLPIAMIVTMAFLGWRCSRYQVNWYTKTHGDSYLRMIDRVSRYDSPGILYYDMGDLGLGVKCSATPPTKYWATQYGVTEEMRQDQQRTLEAGVADIVVTDTCKREPQYWGYVSTDADVVACGYPGSDYMRVWWRQEMDTAEQVRAKKM